jgi:lipoyl(octanoyl) transferase
MILPAKNLPEADLIVVRPLGLHDYEPLWRGMQQFTDARDHLLTPGDIPVIQVDRGGQVTYHGPGQLMIYPLLDLKRAGLGVRDLVTALEQTVISLVAEFDIEAASRKDAPGVYVEGRKIASVGLRIRRGASYHGMALNIDVDLEPFSRINPCGFSDLEVTDLTALGISESRAQIQARVQAHLLHYLHMEHRQIVADI